MHRAWYILKGKDSENLRKNKSSWKIALFPHFLKASEASSQGSCSSWGVFPLHRCPKFSANLDLGIFLYNSTGLSSATPGKVCDSGNQLSLPEPSVHI